jgi:hypothetical protein
MWEREMNSNSPGAHHGTASPGVHGQSVMPGALLAHDTPMVRIDALQLVVPTEAGTIVHWVYHSHAWPMHPPAATSPASATSMFEEPFFSIKAWRRERETGRVSIPCPDTPASIPTTHTPVVVRILSAGIVRGRGCGLEGLCVDVEHTTSRG